MEPINLKSLNTPKEYHYLKSDNLVICNWNDGTISKKKAYKKLMKNRKCECKTPILNSDLQYLNFGKSLVCKCLKCMWEKRSLLVLMHFSLGLSKVQPENLKLFEAISSIKFSVGGFIGSKSFAYYFLGSSKDDFIFLDPHFVQPSVSGLDFHSFQSFKVNTIKEINKFSVSTCASVGFLLHSENDRKEFWLALKKLKEVFGEEFYFDFVEESSE